MKSIKQIREAYNIATNLSEAEDRKLSSLVELGLLDAKKLPALKESLNKPVEQMSSAEKRLFLNLLESVLSEMRVKQSKDIKDYYATPDPRVKRAGYPSQKEVPTVLLLKRKAIRVFPDGQKVALYYAQAIDKYVSIPYGDIGINEQQVNPSNREPEDEDDTSSSNTSSSDTKPERIFSNPKEAGRAKLSIGAPGDPRDVRIRTGLDSYIERLNRQAQAAMADVRENFQNNLESLREGKILDTITSTARTIGDVATGGKLDYLSAARNYAAKNIGAKLGISEPTSYQKELGIQRKATQKSYEQMPQSVQSAVDVAKGFQAGVADSLARKEIQTGLDYVGKKITGDDPEKWGGVTKELEKLGKEYSQEVEKSDTAYQKAPKSYTTGEVGGTVAGTLAVPAAAAGVGLRVAGAGLKYVPKLKSAVPIIKKTTGVADFVAGKGSTAAGTIAAGGHAVSADKDGSSKIRDAAISASEKEPVANVIGKAVRYGINKGIETARRYDPYEVKEQTILKLIPKGSGKILQKSFDDILKDAEKGILTADDLMGLRPLERSRVKKALEQNKSKPAPVSPTPSEPRPSGPPTRRPPGRPQRKVPRRRNDPTWSPAPEPVKKPKPVPPERREPTTVPSEPRKIPDTSPTPASRPRPLQQPENQPWKNADKWESPSGRKKFQDKSKKEENKNRKGEDKPRKRVGTFIPGFSLSVDKGPLTPLNPKLSLNVLAPSGKPYTALDSADLIRQRKALAAQASMEESISLDGNVFELNNRAAEKVTALYESLNKKNKKKMIEMMSESAESLEKVISFAVRQ